MLRTFRLPLSWSSLLQRTVKESIDDNALGLAAELAYYFLLALVPAIAFVAALATFFPDALVDRILANLSEFAPPDVLSIVREQFEALASSRNGSVLTAGLLLALWSSSAALVGITEALNRAYDIVEGRPWWKVRLTAMALTFALATLVLVAFALVLAGGALAESLAIHLGFGVRFANTIKVLEWPLIFLLVVVAIGVVFSVAPDADQDWEWISPGAVLSATLWLAASLLFKAFIARFPDYNATYGSLGGVIVLMLWFYMSGLAILIGAEMNSEIDHASPHAPSVARQIGVRRTIGARAARAFQPLSHWTDSR